MWHNVISRCSNEEVSRSGGIEVMWSNVSPRFIDKCEYCWKVGHKIIVFGSRLGTCLLCGSNEHWEEVVIVFEKLTDWMQQSTG